MSNSNEYTAMFDRLLFGFIVKLVVPTSCFLGAWWISLLFTQSGLAIAGAALSGAAIGMMVNALVERIRGVDVYRISKPTLMLIYLFYTCCMFGFFMGVPIFHPALGATAGYYWSDLGYRASAHQEFVPFGRKLQMLK